MAWHYHTFPQVLPLTFVFFNWNLPGMETSLTLAAPFPFCTLCLYITSGAWRRRHLLALEDPSCLPFLAVRQFLSSGVSPNLANEDGLTALHQVSPAGVGVGQAGLSGGQGIGLRLHVCSAALMTSERWHSSSWRLGLMSMLGTVSAGHLCMLQLPAAICIWWNSSFHGRTCWVSRWWLR